MKDKEGNKLTMGGGIDRVFCIKCRELQPRGEGNICKYCLDGD